MSTAERSTPRREPRPQAVDEDDLTTLPDHLVVALMITDPAEVRRLKAEREESPSAHRDEVWDGVYVKSPRADYEHQAFVGKLTGAFLSLVEFLGGGDVLPGLNVSDRVEGWRTNYRESDVAVFLKGNPSIFRRAFVCGGPDLAVEILSEGDMARKKLEFYAKVNTRELLILDRHPWVLELYRLADGRLDLVGISTSDKSEALTSEVLPLTFRLVPGESRPTLELARLDGAQSWRI